MNRAVLITLFLLSLCLQVSGQPARNAEGRGHGQEKIRAAHAAYITERLGLTPGEAEKFWPVYRQYNEKRRDIRQQFREARRRESDEKKLLELDLKVKQQELELEKDYYARFDKIIPANKLVKLRQAEIDFRRLILRQIQQRRRGN